MLLGLVLGIFLGVFAQLLLKPLEVKNVESVLIFSYGGAEVFRLDRGVYFTVLLIAFVFTISLARWGYRRFRGLHIPVVEKVPHKKPIDVLAAKLLEKLTQLSTLYGYEPPSSKRIGKGFHISLTLSVQYPLPFMPIVTSIKELLTIDVEEQLVTLSCEKDPRLVELTEKLREALMALIEPTAPA